ncbi:YxiJ family protein [Bacillus sp. AFS017336]
MLHFSFFERFAQYKFIEFKIGDYKKFSREFNDFEEVSCMLLKLSIKY